MQDKLLRAAIITASDSGYEGVRSDQSGPIIKEMLEAAGYQIVEMILLPDEQKRLSDKMAQIADRQEAELILTTGGTGCSKRDRMPEATTDIVERLVPGIPEAMRMYSMQITKRAMLGRAVAGIRGETLIINLPGSPKAVKECLEYILPELKHGLEILIGTTGNCG